MRPPLASFCITKYSLISRFTNNSCRSNFFSRVRIVSQKDRLSREFVILIWVLSHKKLLGPMSQNHEQTISENFLKKKAYFQKKFQNKFTKILIFNIIIFMLKLRSNIYSVLLIANKKLKKKSQIL